MYSSEKQHIPEKKREHLIYGILGTVFLLLYFLLISYIFSIPFIVISVIFYGIMLNKQFYNRKKIPAALIISRVAIPAAIIIALWLGNFGGTLYFVYPKFGKEITVLFLSLFFVSIGIGGIVFGKNPIINNHNASYSTFSRAFFPTFFILVLFIIFELITPIYPLSLMFLFAFFALFTFSFFYLYIDSDTLEKSNNASRMVSRSSSVAIYVGILGFLAGLYIALYSSSFAIATLIALILYSMGGAGILVYAIYQGTSKNFKTNSMTVFKKFEKEGSVFMSHDIQNMGEALDSFENEGKKEELIIVVAKFLADRGKNVDYIKKSLKAVIDYKLPNSIIIGASKPGSSVYRSEIEKRKIITKVVIENISVIGEVNE